MLYSKLFASNHLPSAVTSSVAVVCHVGHSELD